MAGFYVSYTIGGKEKRSRSTRINTDLRSDDPVLNHAIGGLIFSGDVPGNSLMVGVEEDIAEISLQNGENEQIGVPIHSLKRGVLVFRDQLPASISIRRKQGTPLVPWGKVEFRDK